MILGWFLLRHLHGPGHFWSDFHMFRKIEVRLICVPRNFCKSLQSSSGQFNYNHRTSIKSVPLLALSYFHKQRHWFFREGALNHSHYVKCVLSIDRFYQHVCVVCWVNVWFLRNTTRFVWIVCCGTLWELKNLGSLLYPSCENSSTSCFEPAWLYISARSVGILRFLQLVMVGEPIPS